VAADVPLSGRHRIVALVLTHNAPQSLARCIAAVDAQVEGPEELRIVDNASEPPVELSRLRPQPPGTARHVIRSDLNGGPAGGWAIALRSFLESDFTHAWLLDDDMLPEPTCLATLWDAVADDPTSAFAFPVAVQPDGSVGRWGSWCGFLISREIVETVGLPMEELFWWAEDTEYCEWRIPKAGFPRRIVEEAVVHHDAIRQVGHIPAWKYYYESRNNLYFHLYLKRRVGRYPRKFIGLLARALVRQKQNRLGCLRAICLGLYDGARGRLGIRYSVSSLHERALSSAGSRRTP
jgi:rhamnopyranosyl-N-acetylglucosaminyl-diphospho-decaprenol beta-1,3/1,4-galactofuranosyltransferase